MSNLFIGLLLVFLDFNLNLGNITIGLIPDFLGYIYMVKGLKELARESMNFRKVEPYASGMIIYTGILYVLDLVGFSALGIISQLLAVISALISLYISYLCVLGVKDMEVMNKQNLNGENLLANWKVMAVCSVLSLILTFIPIINLIFVLITFAVTIGFLVHFNRSKEQYIRWKNIV